MASYQIYPPILQNTTSAFLTGGPCSLYFTLSKYSSASVDDIKGIQISVIQASTNMNIVNKSNNINRYRATGIIILPFSNAILVDAATRLYKIDILAEDISGGWKENTIYKMQLRLSLVNYNGVGNQAEWLRKNGDNFSEWSTYCTTKAIIKPIISIPFLNYISSDSEDNITQVYNFSFSTLNFEASYINADNGDPLYSYQVILYDNNHTLIEDSGILELDYYTNMSKMNYLFKYEFQENGIYYLRFSLTTENGYNENHTFTLDINKQESYKTNISVATVTDIFEREKVITIIPDQPLPDEYGILRGDVDNNGIIDENDLVLLEEYLLNPDNEEIIIGPGADINNDGVIDNEDRTLLIELLETLKPREEIIIEQYTIPGFQYSKIQEEEQGRVGLKLYTDSNDPFFGFICIRRADASDNFSKWVDIKIIPCSGLIEKLDVIYDETIESGVWYKYGVEEIDLVGDRSILNINQTPVLREFEYSFLIGKGGRRLVLPYNVSVGSYTYTISEGKFDTIGGKYPIISRNANTHYRTFSLNGLISFNMDTLESFVSEDNLYKAPKYIKNPINIAQLYRDRRFNENINLYDTKREYDFREEVLKFLQDGKPKLFKSPTEGNIIVSLLNVTLNPEVELNRLTYSFSCTANEVDDNIYDNYINYGFNSIGALNNELINYTQNHIGQLYITIKPGENIIQKIYDKYDASAYNQSGHQLSLVDITNLTISFEDSEGYNVQSGDLSIIGYKFNYNGQDILLNRKFTRKYDFDDSIHFNQNDKLYIDISTNRDIPIIVDFVYSIMDVKFFHNISQIYTYYSSIGQIYGMYEPNTSLMDVVKDKYSYSSNGITRKLSAITWACIEASAGAQFRLNGDNCNNLIVTMNGTDVLDVEAMGKVNNIEYLGNIDNPTAKDIILIDYMYTVQEAKI